MRQFLLRRIFSNALAVRMSAVDDVVDVCETSQRGFESPDANAIRILPSEDQPW